MNIIKKDISTLIPAEYNPRKDLTPSDIEYQNIKNSIETFGYIDPIIYNKRNNKIIGGHQRFKVLKELGYKEIDCVEVDLDDKAEKSLNITLNKVEGEWDFESLQLLLDELDEELKNNLGLSFKELESLEEELLKEKEEEQNKYTDIINIPQYEIKGECPSISELYDLTKTNELINNINKSVLSEEEKHFLKMAAYRHNSFSYSKIAEYYAHADEIMQNLMEESALVIIDVEDAIRNNYTMLKSELNTIMQEDSEEEDY